jgi:methyltransferase (TIGR00027 family)
MQRGQRSVTAEFSAVLRAVHMVLDPQPSIFVDRVAQPLLQLNRQMLEKVLQEQQATAAQYGDPQYAVQVAASLRMFTVLRSRFTRDTFFESGLKQIVLLGAGLDLSLASETDVPVFAVDHPDTSRWTRSLFADTGLQIDTNLHFVEMDFTKGPDVLLPTLAEHGFQPGKPAFFVWLGVQPYLSIEHILETARVVGSCSTGTQLVTDFMTPDTSWSGIGERAGKLLQDSPHRQLEPFKSYSAPAELKRQLLTCGFTTARSIEAEEVNARYCGERADALRYPNCAAMIVAEV